MLSDHEVIATVAVKHLSASAQFYENVLGLRAISSEGDDLIVYQCGDVHVGGDMKVAWFNLVSLN